MKAWFNEGLHVIMNSNHLLFDPSNWFDAHPSPPNVKAPVDMVFISHAHSDHANLLDKYNKVTKFVGKGGKKKTVSIPVILHPATSRLLHWHRIDRPIEMNAGEEVDYGDIHVTTYNSGHCVGALQFKVESSEGSFLFTGDINTEGDISMPAGDIVPADYIAIEATAGDPKHVAPPKRDAYGIIYTFIKEKFNDGYKNVVLYGHSLGKAQHLTKLLGSLQSIDADVFLDSRSYSINRVYEEFRGSMNIVYKELRDNSFHNGGRNIIIYNLYQLKKGKSVAEKYKLKEEPPSLMISAFPAENRDFQSVNLSSHDDFNGIKQYVLEVEKQIGKKPVVIAFHGDHASFTTELKREGFEVYDSHLSIMNK